MRTTPTLTIEYEDGGNIATLFVLLPNHEIGDELEISSGTITEMITVANKWTADRGFQYHTRRVRDELDRLQRAQPGGPTEGVLRLDTLHQDWRERGTWDGHSR